MNRDRTLFNQSISEMLETAKFEVRSKINSEKPDYITNVSDDEYLDFVTDDYNYGQLNVLENSLRLVDTTEEVSYEQDSTYNERYEVRRQSLTFEIDLEGDIQLLYIQPSNRLSWSPQATVMNNSLRFTVVDWNNNPAQVKQDMETFQKNLVTQLQNANREASSFQGQIREYAEKQLTNRKAQLQSFNKTIIELGVPIAKKDAIPSTFAVPSERIAKKVEVLSKTSPTSHAQRPALPDPIIASAIYDDILETIHGVGKVIERLPNIYKDRDENSLRDLLLLYLEPRYTSAAGEVFNSQGKTDILIRYENHNVFIAELKFWKGQQLFNETIEQLFRYLTWRDSKTALVIFCNTKDFSAVIAEVRTQLENHKLIASDITIQDESWLKCKLKFPDDSTKEIYLSVLLFHFK
jgi:hypothetical protein